MMMNAVVETETASKQPAQSTYLVFTDLDGTLLDHDTYDFSPALPAIRHLQQSGIPVIANSSKTLPEIAALCQQISLPDLFIFENGSGLAMSDHWLELLQPPKHLPIEKWQHLNVLSLGVARHQLDDQLKPLSGQFQFTPVCDMTADQFSELTGLRLPEAKAALQRRFSEPVLWQDSDQQLELFSQILQKSGLLVTRGGRFVHVQGPVTKAETMEQVVQWFTEQYSDLSVCSIALGDAPNDFEMLSRADIAVIITNPQGRKLELNDHPCVYRPDLPGPAGWAQAINQIFEHHIQKKNNSNFKGFSYG